MSGMVLLRPWWLVALLPVLALSVWVWRRGASAGGWEQIMPPHMLAAMQAMGAFGAATNGWLRLLPLAALLALVLGLAGPAIRRSDAPMMVRTDSVIIAIDMSPSVARGPALSQAQQAAAALLQGLVGRPVGLILYSGEAYAASAPTTDPAALQTLIGVLDANTVPGQGSRPAAAISLASQMLGQAGQADLVLISDGGGVDAQAVAEADRLAVSGGRIWVLRVSGGVGPPAPAPFGLVPDGQAPDVLAQLVRGGQLDAGTDVDRMAARLMRGGDRMRDPALIALGYRDLGPFLAALAVFPLLMMLRRQR